MAIKKRNTNLLPGMRLLIQEDACALADSEVSNSHGLNTYAGYSHGQWGATWIRLPLLSPLVQCVDDKSCACVEHIVEASLGMPCLRPFLVWRRDARLKKSHRSHILRNQNGVYFLFGSGSLKCPHFKK